MALLMPFLRTTLWYPRSLCVLQFQRLTSSQIDSVEETQELSSEEIDGNEGFDVPKPYLDKKVFDKKMRKLRRIDRRIYTLRALTEWKNDHYSGKNWPERWTAPAPFDPHKVPLDIRMGAAQNMIPKVEKYGNLELLKVQNFLHLTPPAVKKHCEKLKRFCTEWPEELATDEDCEREFPVEIHSTDYVRAGQSQRNPKARIATLKIRLCNLTLDHHARHKIIKLAGDRYDPEADVLTVVADRCPIRKQNREYLDYLLTVLYYESWKVENWETVEYIEDEDGIYSWKDSNSYNSLIEILKHHKKYSSLFDDHGEGRLEPKESLEGLAEVKEYRDAVCKLKIPDPNITDDERKAAMLRYKESVMTLLNLPQL